MVHLLNNLKYPHEIQHYTLEELEQLADECRQRIVEVTSQRGGHLASSLGAVELTVALFKLFDFRQDRIVWDVGHQAYVHKLITGRNEAFDSLTLRGGIKKYLSREESPYDHFGAGHASTSISAALGMAVGRDLNSENHHVVALIGDGSMTGGLAFEALNHGGYLDKRMIVIFNDNGISIDPNVGALSRAITRIIVSKPYNKFRQDTWELAGRIPFSRLFRTVLRKTNASLKTLVTPGALFEKLGWRYFGPVDGHNIEEILQVLSKAKDIEGPIVVHALTQKGKGYSHAENDCHKYHGVTPFVPDSGEFLKKRPTAPNSQSFSKVYGDKLTEIMQKDQAVVAISAAMMSGTGIIDTKKRFPDRVFDVGIAEGHAVTCAAGMATAGLKPFVTIYSTFLQRAFDHIIHDVAIQNLPVRFMMDRGGLVGADGPTHQGVFDHSYMRMIPNMTVMVPKDGNEMLAMMDFAHQHESGPISLRYPRANTVIQENVPLPTIELGKSERLRDGDHIAIFAVGVMVKIAEEVAKLLEERGYSTAVINGRFIKPVDLDAIHTYGAKSYLVVTMEENAVQGGYGSAVLEALSAAGLRPLTLTLGIPDRFIAQGSQDQQREDCGLTVTQALSQIVEKWESLPVEVRTAHKKALAG